MSVMRRNGFVHGLAFCRSLRRAVAAVSVAAASLVFTVCAPRPVCKAGVDYTHPGFSALSFPDRTIMVLPLLWRAPGGEAAIADSAIMSWLGRLREDLSLVPSDQFRRLVRSTLGAAAYDGFMRLLGDGSVVPVQTSDSVWALMDASFALAARVREGIAIRGPGGRLRRGIALDIELWSVPQRQVVWRAVAELAAFDSPVSDRRLLKDALVKGLRLLPAFQPGSNETQW